MDGLQAVAHVGQRPADDDAHRIVEVAGLHLLDDGDGRDGALAAAAAFFLVFAVLDRRFGGQVVSILARAYRRVRVQVWDAPRWRAPAAHELADHDRERHPARARARARQPLNLWSGS